MKEMKVLMVCLGNICRSPLAEGVLSDKIKKAGLNWQVDSAGTSNYHIDEEPDPRSQENALQHDINISHLRGRQFVKEDFQFFDKIYVMDDSNYQNVVKLASNQEDTDKVDLLLNQANPGSNHNVPDPYFGGSGGFENVFQLIDKACDAIIKQYS
ncbi:low molecular weight phosphotyrosine protein phosphatase [Flavobacteriales bacterium]|nr:low molecular weight phosphotyrosine protein phosphatase [Flavobacteriales bacterium]